MKTRIISFAVLILIALSTFAQKEENKGIYFDLPNGNWLLTKRTNIEPGLEAIFYKRVAIKDRKGLKVTPNIAVLIEDLPVLNFDVSLFARHHKSSKRYSHIEMEPYSEVSPGLPNSLVYKGKYTDPQNNEHTVLIVYAVDGRNGVHFIADMRTDLFSEVEEEFMKAIESMDSPL